MQPPFLVLHTTTVRVTLQGVLRGFRRLGPKARKRKIRAYAREAGLVLFVIVLSYAVLSLSTVKNHAASPSPAPVVLEASPSVPSPPPPITLSDTGRLFLDGPAPVSTAVYSPTPISDPLEPQADGLNDVQWVDGLGVPPSRSASGTMFLVGHSWSGTGYALNTLSQFVTARTDFSAPTTRLPSRGVQGSTLTLVDDSGVTASWTIDTAFLIAKQDMERDGDIFDPAPPGRVVLITCAITADKDLDYNVVLIGHRHNGTMPGR